MVRTINSSTNGRILALLNSGCRWGSMGVSSRDRSWRDDRRQSRGRLISDGSPRSRRKVIQAGSREEGSGVQCYQIQLARNAGRARSRISIARPSPRGGRISKRPRPRVTLRETRTLPRRVNLNFTLM